MNRIPDQFTLVLTPAAWNYWRAALDRCPLGEARQLADNLDAQVAEQIARARQAEVPARANGNGAAGEIVLQPEVTQ